jgi:TonB family protein
MRAALLFLAVLAASAQAGEDARSLLKSISNAMRSADSLRVEGMSVRDTTGEQGTSHQEISFELVTRGPLVMRYHRAGPSPGLQVCDGASLWTYAEASNSYVKGAANVEDCNPPFARWSDLSKYLVEAKVIGNDHSDFEGRPQDCEVIDATYETPRPLLPEVPSAGRMERIFCVDPLRRLILREQLGPSPAASSTGGVHFSMTITYSHVELNPALEPSVFQFQPPDGSHEASAEVQKVAARIDPPTLISKHEPKYSSEARRARLQGSVLVSLVVGTDGIPQNVKVLRGLGLGLDEKAVEAVQGWKFQPARKAGEPIAVPAQVEVSFRLHQP